MELKTYTVQDATGAIVPGALAFLYKYPGGELATGLKDKNGAEIINPIKADDNGAVTFMAPNGQYEIQFAVGPAQGNRVIIQFLDVRETTDEARTYAEAAIQAKKDVEGITMAQTYTTYQAGLAGSTDGQIFRVIFGTSSSASFAYYRRISAISAEALQTTPSMQSTVTLSNQVASKLEAERFNAMFGKTRQAETIAFAIRDAEGRQTWLAINGEDGGPTQWAEHLIRQRLGLNDRDSMAAGIEELAFALTDSDERLTDLAVRQSDGQLADFAVSRLAVRIGQKLGVSADTVAQLLAGMKITPDYPGFQIMSSISRWAGSRHLGGSVSSPVNFGTRTYNQAARMTFAGPYSDPQALLLVLYVGGVNSGSDLTVPEYIQPLLGEGVVVARCNYHGNHYGQPQAIQDMVDVYENVCKTLPIGGVILLGNSMGGMLALNALTTRAIPGVLGLYLTDPVANLADRYESTRKEMIQAAYGIDPNGLDYTAKTMGYDPMLRDWSDYRGIPVAITGSTGDDLVPFAMNGLMLNDKLKAHNDVTLYTLSSAGHNTTDRFNITNLRAFIKKCVQGNILK